MKQVNKLLSDELKNCENQLKLVISQIEKMKQELQYKETEKLMLNTRCNELTNALDKLSQEDEVKVVKSTRKNKKT